MAQKSSLNTATKPATVTADCTVALNPKINTDDVIITTKAKNAISELESAYQDAYNKFDKLIEPFVTLYNDHLREGTSLRKKVDKVIDQLTNQANYILNKKKQLAELSAKTSNTESVTDEMDSALALISGITAASVMSGSSYLTAEDKTKLQTANETLAIEFMKKYGTNGTQDMSGANLTEAQKATLEQAVLMAKSVGIGEDGNKISTTPTSTPSGATGTGDNGSAGTGNNGASGDAGQSK